MPLTPRQEEMVRNATPMDDFTVRLMLRETPALAELFLHIILTKMNLRVVKLRTQFDASRGGIARGVTLDALVEDNAGRVENIEIQINAHGWSPKRGRYHSAILDIEYLDAGSDFSALPESFVIFICDDDPYGKGEPVYLVKRAVYTTDRQDYTKAKDYVQDYDDCEYILYVNGAWRGDDALGRLMHDFHCANPDDMHYPLMGERLRYIKETEAGKVELAGLAEEFFNEGMAKGMAEGMAKGKAEGMAEGKAEGMAEGMIEGKQDEAKDIAIRLLKTGTMTLHQIAEVVPRLSVEELKKMQAEVSPTT